MIEFLRSWVEAIPSKAIGDYEFQHDQVMIENVTRKLEQAVFSWMGPGGDEAFVEMFGLANNLADFPVIASTYGPNFFTSYSFQQYVEREKHNSASEEYRKVHGSWPNGPWDERKYLAMSPSFASLERMVLLGSLSTIVVANAQMGIHAPFGKTIVIVARPRPDFREVLMGELAEPWEAIESQQAVGAQGRQS